MNIQTSIKKVTDTNFRKAYDKYVTTVAFEDKLKYPDWLDAVSLGKEQIPKE